VQSIKAVPFGFIKRFRLYNVVSGLVLVLVLDALIGIFITSKSVWNSTLNYLIISCSPLVIGISTKEKAPKIFLAWYSAWLEVEN
jgi:hypothetical protein